MFFGAGQGSIFVNPLQIPSLFETPYHIMLRIGLLLFSTFFVVAILHENLQALKNNSDYTGFFVRTLLVIGLLILYDRLFVWVVYGMDLASDAILPHQEFQQVADAFLNQPFNWKHPWKFASDFTVTLVNYITYLFAAMILGALLYVRFALLALLYVIGPMVAGIGIYKGTSQGLSAWTRSLVAVSSWKLLLAVLMKVVSTMNLVGVYAGERTNLLSVLVANTTFIVLFVMVPVVANQFISGGSLSSVGSVTLGAMTAVVNRYVVRPMFDPRKPRLPNPGSPGRGGAHHP
jgi:hypothetical protein